MKKTVDNLVSYVISSQPRIDMLHSLGSNGKMTANEVSKKVQVSYTYGWKLLQGLKEHGIVNHNDVHRNRLYFLTNLGKRVLLAVDER